MQEERIAKMAENVAADMTGEIALPSMPQIRTAAADPDEDVALANVDQALDVMLAAVKTIDANLGQVKTGSVPEKAAVDAIDDLMQSAIKPYLADIFKAMQTLK